MYNVCQKYSHKIINQKNRHQSRWRKQKKMNEIKQIRTQFQQINDHLTNQERYRNMVTQNDEQRKRVCEPAARKKHTHTHSLNHYYWTKSIYWVSYMIDIDFFRTFPHCDAVRFFLFIRNYFVNAICYLVLLFLLRLLLLLLPLL